MAITKIQEPVSQVDKLIPAHNLIPTIIDSDNSGEPFFKYLTDFGTDKLFVPSNSTELEVYRNKNRLRVNANQNHNFDVGDYVIFVNAGDFSGLHKVIQIPDSNSFVIDLKTNSTYDQSFDVWKTYRMSSKPRPKDSYGVFDMSSIASGLVNNHFDPSKTGVTINNDLTQTVRQFYSESYQYAWDFIDNRIENGNVGFTGTTTPPFSNDQFVTVTQERPQYLDVYEIINNSSNNTSNLVIVTGNSQGDVTHLFNEGDQYTIINANDSTNNKEYTVDGMIYDSANDYTILHTFTDVNSEGPPTSAETTFSVPQVYEGRHKINNVDTNNNIIEINVPYAFNTPAIPGTVKVLPAQITPDFNLEDSEPYTIFDGALRGNDIRTYDSDIHRMDSAGDNLFLASHYITDSERVKKDSYLDINFWGRESNAVKGYGQIRLETTNKNSTDGEYVINIDKSSLSGTHTQSWTFHSGPKQLNDIASSEVTVSANTLPMIKDDTVEYTFWVEAGDGTRVSEKWNVKVYDPDYWGNTCRPYQTTRLLFKDRYGSFQGFFMSLIRLGEISYERNNFRDGSLKVHNDQIDNRSHTRGLTNQYNDQEKIATVTTEYLSEAEFEWMKELLDSPEIYMEYDEFDELVPVVIDGDSVDIVKDAARPIQNVELDIRIANREIRQRN